MAIARLEKPHWGKSAVPFMNRTTSFELTISSRRALVSVIGKFLIGGGGGQLERVELSPHPPAERFVDALVLADPRQAAEALGDDAGGIMVAVAGQVGDLDPRVGNGGADQLLDVGRGHRHRGYQLPACMSWRRASTVLWASASRILASSHSTPAAVRSPSTLRITSSSPASSKSARMTSLA